ncbi:MAG: asparaginase domain-containing protein [Planctomycetota bacterium]
MRHVTLISTGGTIEKTYDERTGALDNRHSIVHHMLAQLRLDDVAVNTVQLFQKDSLHLTDSDRQKITEMVRLLADIDDFDGPEESGTDGIDGIVILHGTDTLCDTGDLLAAELPNVRIPVILTGAMRPFEMQRSDALQNLNEALFATGVLEPGVWCVAHGKALRFPGVAKDRERGTFARSDG